MNARTLKLYIIPLMSTLVGVMSIGKLIQRDRWQKEFRKMEIEFKIDYYGRERLMDRFNNFDTHYQVLLKSTAPFKNASLTESEKIILYKAIFTARFLANYPDETTRIELIHKTVPIPDAHAFNCLENGNLEFQGSHRSKIIVKEVYNGEFLIDDILVDNR